MNLSPALLSAAVGYFLGAISFARIIGSLVAPGEDMSRSELPIRGSNKKFIFHAVSATSVRTRAGPLYGILTTLLDMLKAALPVLFFRLSYPHDDYFLITAIASIAGHNFPIYYRFKGGRGMSPLFGGLLVINWLAIPVTIIGGMAIGVGLLRDWFIAIVSGPLFLIPWLWFQFRTWPYLVYTVSVNILFWIAFIPEVKEYLKLKRSRDRDVSCA